MLFNINNYVEVQLTDIGVDILERRWLNVSSGLNLSLVDFYKEYENVQVPIEGKWIKFQLWELMSIFGNHMGLGFEEPFETEIKI